MLVLTRRLGETLRIGDDIEVVITGVERHQVSLGINAPREIVIVREELLKRKTNTGDETEEITTT